MNYQGVFPDVTIRTFVRCLWGIEDLSSLKEAVYDLRCDFPRQLPEGNLPAVLPWLLNRLKRSYIGKNPRTCQLEGWNVGMVYDLFALAFALASHETEAVIDSIVT
jgi:hypothetical protein